jgi:hypothetical protein
MMPKVSQVREMAGDIRRVKGWVTRIKKLRSGLMSGRVKNRVRGDQSCLRDSWEPPVVVPEMVVVVVVRGGVGEGVVGAEGFEVGGEGERGLELGFEGSEDVVLLVLDLALRWWRMRMLSVAQWTASWAKCWFRAMRVGEWRACL